MGSIGLKANELLTFYIGCYGNQLTIATMVVANVFCPKKALYHKKAQYDVRKMSYWHITVVAMAT